MAAKAGRSLCLALVLVEAARALQSGGPDLGPGSRFPVQHGYGAGQQQRQERQVGSGLGMTLGVSMARHCNRK